MIVDLGVSEYVFTNHDCLGPIPEVKEETRELADVTRVPSKHLGMAYVILGGMKLVLQSVFQTLI